MDASLPTGHPTNATQQQAKVSRGKDDTVKPALVTTCIEGPPVYKDHIFVSLENGSSLKHVLKELVHKDHLPMKCMRLLEMCTLMQKKKMLIKNGCSTFWNQALHI